jgi:hypothetical protein
LLTLAERLLAGARPDVDFIEFNPPAAYLIYVPAAAVARFVGTASEPILIGMVAGLTTFSVWASGAILGRAQLMERWQVPAMMAAAFVALLIFAYSSFAQREHLALIAMLPMLAVYASRANLIAPRRWAALLSGVAGGIAVCIKPYFALALVLPLIGVAWNNRRVPRGVLRALFAAENFGAALAVLIYAASVVVLFPAFLVHTLPLVFAVYIPVREPLMRMFTGIRFSAFALMTAALIPLGAGELAKPVPIIGLLAATGFLLAMFAQGRIWFDHAYPALALLMMVTAWLMLARALRARELNRRAQLLSWVVIAACALPALGTMIASSAAWFAEASNLETFVENLRPLVPSHPKVIAISERYAFVPVARALQGAWVGSTYFQIISWNADEQLAKGGLDEGTRDRLDAYAHFDREVLARDIRLRRPDVILVDERSLGWALSHAEIASALRGYYEVRKIDKVLVWLPDASERRSSTR